MSVIELISVLKLGNGAKSRLDFVGQIRAYPAVNRSSIRGAMVDCLDYALSTQQKSPFPGYIACSPAS